MSTVQNSEPTEGLKLAISVDDNQVADHLKMVVRSTVEETLNAMLDQEADEICRAKRYERTPERVDTRAGHYERELETTAGTVKLKVPRLRSLPFESQILGKKFA